MTDEEIEEILNFNEDMGGAEHSNTEGTAPLREYENAEPVSIGIVNVICYKFGVFVRYGFQSGVMFHECTKSTMFRQEIEVPMPPRENAALALEVEELRHELNRMAAKETVSKRVTFHAVTSSYM